MITIPSHFCFGAGYPIIRDLCRISAQADRQRALAAKVADARNVVLGAARQKNQLSPYGAPDWSKLPDWPAWFELMKDQPI